MATVGMIWKLKLWALWLNSKKGRRIWMWWLQPWSLQRSATTRKRRRRKRKRKGVGTLDIIELAALDRNIRSKWVLLRDKVRRHASWGFFKTERWYYINLYNHITSRSCHLHFPPTPFHLYLPRTPCRSPSSAGARYQHPNNMQMVPVNSGGWGQGPWQNQKLGKEMWEIGFGKKCGQIVALEQSVGTL